jgi:hypothetical protein
MAHSDAVRWPHRARQRRLEATAEVISSFFARRHYSSPKQWPDSGSLTLRVSDWLALGSGGDIYKLRCKTVRGVTERRIRTASQLLAMAGSLNKERLTREHERVEKAKAES